MISSRIFIVCNKIYLMTNNMSSKNFITDKIMIKYQFY